MGRAMGGMLGGVARQLQQQQQQVSSACVLEGCLRHVLEHVNHTS